MASSVSLLASIELANALRQMLLFLVKASRRQLPLVNISSLTVTILLVRRRIDRAVRTIQAEADAAFANHDLAAVFIINDRIRFLKRLAITWRRVASDFAAANISSSQECNGGGISLGPIRRKNRKDSVMISLQSSAEVACEISERMVLQLQIREPQPEIEVVPPSAVAMETSLSAMETSSSVMEFRLMRDEIEAIGRSSGEARERAEYENIVRGMERLLQPPPTPAGSSSDSQSSGRVRD